MTAKKTSPAAKVRKDVKPARTRVRGAIVEAVDEDRLSRMADDVERGDYRPVPGTLDGPLLRMGRPAASEAGRGKSPVRTVRLPRHLDERLTKYADSAGSTPSDVLRQAVVEYMDRHPLEA